MIATCLFYLGGELLLNFVANRIRLPSHKNNTRYMPAIRKKGEQNVQILTYHRVNDENDPFFAGIPIETFARQMEYLSARFTIWPLEQVVEGMKKKDIPHNTLVVTFDDGYADNYFNAYPILKAYRIPATIFLTTDVIGTNGELWHDRIFSAFRETQVESLTWDADRGRVYPLSTVEQRLYAQSCVLQLLWSVGEEQRLQWVDRLSTALKVKAGQVRPRLMLTWDEIQVMQRGGVAFGGHTCSHPILSKLSPVRIQTEILESKRILEEHLQQPVTTFAYPNGRKCDFDETTKSLLREAGYQCAVTTVFGRNEIGQDLFELHRGRPWETHLPAFAMKLNWYKLAV
ncbi:MAG: polysaccharide deacetylase family protein [Candidatus Binatia bacterium]